MAQMLELSDKDFKVTLVNILKDLMEKGAQHAQINGKFLADRWR